MLIVFFALTQTSEMPQWLVRALHEATLRNIPPQGQPVRKAFQRSARLPAPRPLRVDFSPLNAHIEDDPEDCAHCIEIVEYFMQDATKVSSAVMLREMVEGSCERFHFARSVCDEVGQPQAEELLKFLKNKFTGRQICQFAGLCPL